MNNYDDDGLINLAAAIIETAKWDVTSPSRTVRADVDRETAELFVRSEWFQLMTVACFRHHIDAERVLKLWKRNGRNGRKVSQ